MGFEDAPSKGSKSVPEKTLCRRCRGVVVAGSNYCAFCGAAQKEGLLGVSTKWRDKVVGSPKEMPPHLRNVREQLLETIQSRTEGLNMEGIKDFFDKHGLSYEEVIVINDEDILRVNELLAQAELESIDFQDAPCGGVRIANLQISFVYRNEEHEKKFGAGSIEHDIVHEASHGSTGYREFIERKNEDTNSSYAIPQRVGFSPSNSFERAVFFEEAFAELMAGKYQEEIYERKEKWGGFVEVGNRSWIRLAEKYGEEGNTRVAGIAAAAVELILDRDPELFDIMIKARKDVNQLREFIKKINKVSPGLYVALRKMRYTNEDFAEGYDKIRVALAT